MGTFVTKQSELSTKEKKETRLFNIRFSKGTKRKPHHAIERIRFRQRSMSRNR